MSIYGTGTAPVTELLIDGTWADVSSRSRAAQKITIKRGRSNEQGRTSAQTCQTTVNNRDGVLSNRNPNSQYFGKLPRNTQLRVTAGAGDNYLKMPYSDALFDTTTLFNVSTADKAVLDVTGDIDIRCEVQPYTWRSTVNMSLMSKYQSASNQRSWVFFARLDGTLGLAWSPDGTTASRIVIVSTAAVPSTSGRLAVRATLDVNNGSAGNTVTFYTSPTIGGTWTILGSAVVTAGTTSVFSSSADLVCGGIDDFQNLTGLDVNGARAIGFGGRYFKAEFYNGIAGTLRARMDATAQTVGATSWSDGLGTPNTWTLTGSTTRITTDRIRFTGETSSLPQAWDLSGTDVTIGVTASGIIRRLTQGATPLRSAMYRNFSQYMPCGYWPLEDGSTTVKPSSAIDGGLVGQAVDVSFQIDDPTLPGAASIAQFTDTASVLKFNASPAVSTGVLSFVFYIRVSALPAAKKTIATFKTTGTARSVVISLTPTTWDVDFFDGGGTLLANGSVLFGTGTNPATSWVGYNLLLQQSGSDVNYSIRWDPVGGPEGLGVGPVAITTATCGVPSSVVFSASADAAFNDAKFSSVFMSTGNFNLVNAQFRNASTAWTNETAGHRLIRLGLEENEPIEVWGLWDDSELMGPQAPDTFINLVYDCWDTDGGIGGECRDVLSLFYRTRSSLEGRSDITLDYEQSHLAEVPLPTEDDLAFTNDVTVSRPSGSSARAVRDDGPTSVSDPPDGVGRYATSISANAASDDRLDPIAGWAMLVGSWDDARYPSLAIGLHRTELTGNAALTGQVIGLELGDTGVLINLPVWLPPDDVPELVQGYTEVLDKFTWTITVNATPAGPYLAVGILGSDVTVIRLDGSTHSLAGTMTTTATSISLKTETGSAVWVDSATYPAEFPMAIKLAGEVMTLTAVVGTTSPQAGTVARSANGIVKTHGIGELTRLASPYYVGR